MFSDEIHGMKHACFLLVILLPLGCFATYYHHCQYSPQQRFLHSSSTRWPSTLALTVTLVSYRIPSNPDPLNPDPFATLLLIPYSNMLPYPNILSYYQSANEPDPSNPDYGGTHTLRMSAGRKAVFKSLSLHFVDRTLDCEFDSVGLFNEV